MTSFLEEFARFCKIEAELTARHFLDEIARTSLKRSHNYSLGRMAYGVVVRLSPFRSIEGGRVRRLAVWLVGGSRLSNEAPMKGTVRREVVNAGLRGY